MGTKINLSNKKFGKLLVMEELPHRKNGSIVWKCLCDCGNIVNVKSASLIEERTRSCGCINAAKIPNLIGQKFGTLTVIGKATEEFKIKKLTTWKCQCNCGEIVYAGTSNLNSRPNRSCKKCVNKKKPQLDLVNKKFGKLTVISPEFDENRKKSFTWKCQCECGNISYVQTTTLKSGHTKSCGCGEIENKINNCAKGRKQRTENRKDPKIALAEWLYKNRYSDGDLSFEDFFNLSQQNCFYCDAPPSNDLKFSSNSWTEEYKLASRFIYNGLDRKNPEELHTSDNVVPSCWNCNAGKINFQFDQFVNRFIKIHKISELGRDMVLTPNNEAIIAYLYNIGIYRDSLSKFHPNIRIILSECGRELEKRFYGRKAKSAKCRYSDGDMTFNQFAYFVLQPCYYCGEISSNKVKYYENSELKYLNINGVDRLDNSLPHNLDNSVPCCKFCNYAKRKRSYQEFISWAERAYNNLKSKNIIK